MTRADLETYAAELQKSLAAGTPQGGLTVMPSRVEQVDMGWKQVVAAMRQCQARLGRHPKVQFFTISRDEREVSIKVNDGTPRGVYVILSRSHPTQRDAPADRVWLTETGHPERGFPEPGEALAHLMGRVAARF